MHQVVLVVPKVVSIRRQSSTSRLHRQHLDEVGSSVTLTSLSVQPVLRVAAGALSVVTRMPPGPAINSSQEFVCSMAADQQQDLYSMDS